MNKNLWKEKLLKKLINFNLQDKHKNGILSIKDFVEKVSEYIPEFIKENLNKAKNGKILEYINSNPYDCQVIKIDNCNEIETEDLLTVNNNLITYNEYSRIKFNLNFERDLEILELQNELKNALDTIKTADNILERLNALNSEFNEKHESLNKQASLIESCLVVFNYEKLFTEITPEQFVKEMNKDFGDKNDKIDLFGKEISNTKLFLYLLKANLYNEKAFKSTQEIDEN